MNKAARRQWKDHNHTTSSNTLPQHTIKTNRSIRKHIDFLGRRVNFTFVYHGSCLSITSGTLNCWRAFKGAQSTSLITHIIFITRTCNVEYWFWRHVSRHKSMVRDAGRIPPQISACINNGNPAPSHPLLDSGMRLGPNWFESAYTIHAISCLHSDNTTDWQTLFFFFESEYKVRSIYLLSLATAAVPITN